jgi:drug/metabolite transporter (DMT)-like permease
VLTAAISLALTAARLNCSAHLPQRPAALMAIPMFGEWPTRIAWAAILIIATGVFLTNGAPLPATRQRMSAQRP